MCERLLNLFVDDQWLTKTSTETICILYNPEYSVILLSAQLACWKPDGRGPTEDKRAIFITQSSESDGHWEYPGKTLIEMLSSFLNV